MNPLLVALRSLTPGKIMRLGGVDEITFGAEMAENMDVGIEGWRDGGRVLVAGVAGHVVEIARDPQTRRLGTSCSCHPGDETASCEHAIAALITFSGLLRHGSISHRPPRDPKLAGELVQRLLEAPDSETGDPGTGDPGTGDPGNGNPPGPIPETASLGLTPARRETLKLVADGEGGATIESRFSLILRGGGRWQRIVDAQQAMRGPSPARVVETLAALEDDFAIRVSTGTGPLPLPPLDRLARGRFIIRLDRRGDRVVCSTILQVLENPTRETARILHVSHGLVIADDNTFVQVENPDLLESGRSGTGLRVTSDDLEPEQRERFEFPPPRQGRPLPAQRPVEVSIDLWRRLRPALPMAAADGPFNLPGAAVRITVDGNPVQPDHVPLAPVIQLRGSDPGAVDPATEATGPMPSGDPAAQATVHVRIALTAHGIELPAGLDILRDGLREGSLFDRLRPEWDTEFDPRDNPLVIRDVERETWPDGEAEEPGGSQSQDDADVIECLIADRPDSGDSRLVEVGRKPGLHQRVPDWRFESVNGFRVGFHPAAASRNELIQLLWHWLDALVSGDEIDAESLKMDLPHMLVVLARRASGKGGDLSRLMGPIALPLDRDDGGSPGWVLVERILEAGLLGLRVASPLATSPASLWKKDSRPSGWWPVRAQRFNAQLPELLRLASLHGVGVTWEGHPIEHVDPEVKLDARVIDGKPDWFALDPEVAWADFKLEHKEWIRLLTSGLLKDDRLLLAAPAARERLEALDQVLGGASGEPDEPVPRLRMFDWLELRRRGVEVTVPDEIRQLIQRLAEPERIEPVPVPTGLQAAMRPYQERGYQWLAFLYTHRFGACLADDMGLGKTLQAIALLAGRHEGRVPGGGAADRPHLVVLPPTLVFNWQAELRRFYPQLEVLEYRGGRKRFDFPPGAVVLTTYDQVRLRVDELAAVEFDCLIFDEAQAAKNWSSKRAMAARRLRARFRLCLTGTPLENHVGEYHSIMELALPGLFGARKDFLRSLKEDDARAAVLLNRARPFVMRRTKGLILTELPPKVEAEISLPCDPLQREMYTRTVAEVRQDIAEAYQLQTQARAGIKALAALMRLRQICISPALLDPGHSDPSPKLRVLAGKLAELMDESQAALVFSQFTGALDLVEQALDAESVPFQRLDGSTARPQRRELVEAFQDGRGPGVFLISLKTGGAGLNLTRASHVFHLDPWWNPAVEHQATDRAHRIGQHGSVFVHRLIMQHTIEESMMRLKRSKQAVYDRIMTQASGLATRGIDEGASAARGALLTREDFEFLLGTGEAG